VSLSSGVPRQLLNAMLRSIASSAATSTSRTSSNVGRPVTATRRWRRRGLRGVPAPQIALIARSDPVGRRHIGASPARHRYAGGQAAWHRARGRSGPRALCGHLPSRLPAAPARGEAKAWQDRSSSPGSAGAIGAASSAMHEPLQCDEPRQTPSMSASSRAVLAHASDGRGRHGRSARRSSASATPPLDRKGTSRLPARRVLLLGAGSRRR